MIRHRFYDSPAYQRAQAARVSDAWRKGVYAHLQTERETRICRRDGCRKAFQVVHHDPKVYCSHSCAAIVSNITRGSLAPETRRKIAIAVTGLPGINKGKILVPRTESTCPRCGVIFHFPRWMKRQYCSAACAIRDVGSRPTSPRAARAIAGIRPDIDPTLYFFSRWEANYARLLNFQKVRWIFQPRRFELETQKYTPDFYLPDTDEYVEIKNYMSEYSKKRDTEFRKCFPDIRLTLILKHDYLKLQEEYAPLIEGWEYSTMRRRIEPKTA